MSDLYFRLPSPVEFKKKRTSVAGQRKTTPAQRSQHERDYRREHLIFDGEHVATVVGDEE
jgi:hypothetical protein